MAPLYPIRRPCLGLPTRILPPHLITAAALIHAAPAPAAVLAAVEEQPGAAGGVRALLDPRDLLRQKQLDGRLDDRPDHTVERLRLHPFPHVAVGRRQQARVLQRRAVLCPQRVEIAWRRSLAARDR